MVGGCVEGEEWVDFAVGGAGGRSRRRVVFCPVTALRVVSYVAVSSRLCSG